MNLPLFIAQPADRNVQRRIIRRLRCALPGQVPATVKLPLSSGAQPLAGQPEWLHLPEAYLRIYA